GLAGAPERCMFLDAALQLRRDPASLYRTKRHDVDGDPELAQLFCCGPAVRLRAYLLAPYDTSLAKPGAPSVLMLMIRPHDAPRATCRRANSAIVSATARLLTAKCRSWLSAVIGWSAAPPAARSSALSFPGGRNGAGSQYAGLLTSTRIGRKACSARSNSKGTVAGSARSASSLSTRPPAARICRTTVSAVSC